MPKHTPAERAKGAKGTKAKSGVVAEITENDLQPEADVVVRHGPKPKKDKDGMMTSFPPTTRLKVPRGAGLAIGDKVEIELRKSGSRGGDGRGSSGGSRGMRGARV